jgi:hypothetical protein
VRQVDPTTDNVLIGPDRPLAYQTNWVTATRICDESFGLDPKPARRVEYIGLFDNDGVFVADGRPAQGAHLRRQHSKPPGSIDSRAPLPGARHYVERKAKVEREAKGTPWLRDELRRWKSNGIDGN